MAGGVELCQVVGVPDNCLVQSRSLPGDGRLSCTPSTGQMKLPGSTPACVITACFQQRRLAPVGGSRVLAGEQAGLPLSQRAHLCLL